MLVAGSHTILAQEDEPVLVIHKTRHELKPINFIDEAGNSVSISKFHGKVVILNFWASWCGPCVHEMPALVNLQKKYGPLGLQVVPVSQDWAKDQATIIERVKKFYAAHHLDGLPLFIDDKGAASDVVGGDSLPTTVIIDRDGYERARVEGEPEWGSARTGKFIESLLQP